MLSFEVEGEKKYLADANKSTHGLSFQLPCSIPKIIKKLKKLPEKLSSNPIC